MPLIDDEEFKEFFCPITQSLIKDPVSTADGHTYERTAIQEWLNGHDTSPATGLILPLGADGQVNKSLIPNHLYRQLFNSFLERRKICSNADFFAAVRQGQLERLKKELNYYSRHLEAIDEKADRRTALLEACYYGHADIVALLHEQRADLAVSDSSGKGPVHLACQAGHAPVTQKLLELKVEPDTKDLEGNRPLHLAAIRGHTDVLSLLLEARVDWEVKDNNGFTALHLAVQNGHEATTRSLLAVGADAEVRTENDLTSLHLAIKKGHKSVVAALLEAGADQEAETWDRNYKAAKGKGWRERRKTPFELALNLEGEQFSAIIKLLIDYKPDIAKAKEAKHAMMKACRMNDTVLVKYLLAAKVDVSIADEDEDYAPLHAWINKESEDEEVKSIDIDRNEIVKLLLESKADPNTKHEGRTPLHNATRVDDVKIVQTLLTANADVNAAEDDERFTPLHLAKSSVVIKTLLDAKADVNTESSNGETPIHRSVEADNIEAIQTLLEAKADVDAVDDEGNTPLHKAGSSLAVKALLEYKADINAKNSQVVSGRSARTGQKTPLLKCLGNYEVMQALIDAKADVTATDDNDSTALHLAAQGSIPKGVQMLLDAKIDVAAQDKDGNTALHGASRSEIIELLLAAHADPSTKNSKGQTALHYVAEHGDVKAIQTLLNAKADVNVSDHDQTTPLHRASHYRYETDNDEKMSLLIRAKADVDAKDSKGNTAIHLLTSSYYSEYLIKSIKAMLAANANPNLQNSEGDTVLHNLAARGTDALVETIKLLLTAKANPSIKNYQQQTPLHKAVIRGNVNIVQTFMDAKTEIEAQDNEGNTVLHLASQYGHINIMKLLLAAGAKRTTRNSLNYSPLSKAVWYHQTEAVKLLLFGEEPPPPTFFYKYSRYVIDDLWWPLYVSCEHGYNDVLKLLLEAGAGTKTNSQTADGVTPVFKACENGHVSIIQTLCEAKLELDLDIKNKHGETPFLLAAKKGHSGVVKLLLNFMVERRTQLVVKHNEKLREERIKSEAELKRTIAANEQKLKAEHEKSVWNPWDPYSHTRRFTDLEVDYKKKLATERQRIETEFKKSLEAKETNLEADYKNEFSAEKATITKAFILAAENGCSEVIKILQECKTYELNIEAKQYDSATLDTLTPNYTALELAAQKGHVETVKVLLLLLEKKYPYTLQKNPTTQEALRLAVGQGHQDVIKVFIEQKADLTIKNSKNETLLHVAASNGHNQVVELLLSTKAIDLESKDTQGDTPFIEACYAGHEHVAKTLLNAGANINAADSGGKTALYWASDRDQRPIINLLLEAKADMSISDKDGQTPLHIVSTKGHVEVVKMLIVAHAPISAEDKEGNTPLHRAAAGDKFYGTTVRHTEIINLLLENKANPEAVNKEGQTAMHLAAMFGTAGLKQLLAANAYHEPLDKKGRTPLQLAREHNLDTALVIQEHHRRFVQAAIEAPKQIAELRAIIAEQQQQILRLGAKVQQLLESSQKSSERPASPHLTPITLATNRNSILVTSPSGESKRNGDISVVRTETGKETFFELS